MNKKNTQPSFFEDPDAHKSWKKEWEDMPEFIQEDLQPKQSIIVHFETKEDRETFAKLIKQHLTRKTKSIWFPEVLPMNLTNKICTDES
jgi:hypothetical protein